jgi:hypothetical protein
MGLAYDLGVNAGAAILGAGATAGSIRLRRTIRDRVDRSFWRFLERPTIFVAGDLTSSVLLNDLAEMLKSRSPGEEGQRELLTAVVERVDDQEISGLIGRGDFEAITKLVTRFATVRLPTDLPILRPSEVTPAQRKQNLVLIGGRDVNSLTEQFSERMGCRLEATLNSEDRAIVRDSHLGKDYAVEIDGPDRRGMTRTLDYGVLARARNPENREREVVIMAGAHGFGTMAAAEATLDREHQQSLLHPYERYGDVEALISYERRDRGVAKGQPVIGLEYARPISHRRS